MIFQNQTALHPFHDIRDDRKCDEVSRLVNDLVLHSLSELERLEIKIQKGLCQPLFIDGKHGIRNRFQQRHIRIFQVLQHFPEQSALHGPLTI